MDAKPGQGRADGFHFDWPVCTSQVSQSTSGSIALHYQGTFWDEVHAGRSSSSQWYNIKTATRMGKGEQARVNIHHQNKETRGDDWYLAGLTS